MLLVPKTVSNVQVYSMRKNLWDHSCYYTLDNTTVQKIYVANLGKEMEFIFIVIGII